MRRYKTKIGIPILVLAATWWSAALAQSSGSTGSVTGEASGSGTIGMSGQQSGQVYTEDFESGTPSNWEFLGGASVVQSGQDHVLAFSGGGIAAWGVQPGGDFTLSFRIRQAGDAPEIMLSHKGEPPNEEYYVVRLFPDETEVVKFTGSQQSSLGYTGQGIGHETWNNVEITMLMAGQSISVNVAGQPLLTVQDPQPYEPGIIAFRAVGTGGSEIDDLVLTVGPASGSAPSSPGGSQGGNMPVPAEPQSEGPAGATATPAQSGDN
jgi:hypothetical protein